MYNIGLKRVRRRPMAAYTYVHIFYSTDLNEYTPIIFTQTCDILQYIVWFE